MTTNDEEMISCVDFSDWMGVCQRHKDYCEVQCYPLTPEGVTTLEKHLMMTTAILLAPEVRYWALDKDQGVLFGGRTEDACMEHQASSSLRNWAEEKVNETKRKRARRHFFARMVDWIMGGVLMLLILHVLLTIWS